MKFLMSGPHGWVPRCLACSFGLISIFQYKLRAKWQKKSEATIRSSLIQTGSKLASDFSVRPVATQCCSSASPTAITTTVDIDIQGRSNSRLLNITGTMFQGTVQRQNIATKISHQKLSSYTAQRHPATCWRLGVQFQ